MKTNNIDSTQNQKGSKSKIQRLNRRTRLKFKHMKKKKH